MSQPPRFRREPPPPAIVYNTSMTTPDAALALAALWAHERERRIRVGGVCVTGGGYKAAVFCDIVNQFYRPGERHGNDALAVGLAGIDALPPDEPMVAAPVDRADAAGDPFYARTIDRPTDTSLAPAHLRNAITFNARNSVLLSAPATSLARSLQIANNRDIYSEPVRHLILVDSPMLRADSDALEYLLERWPTEIVVVPAESTAGLELSSAALDEAFGWTAAHPVVDAYRAFRSVPYALPAQDLAAMAFALDPESGPFELSERGAADGTGLGGAGRRLLRIPDGAKATLAARLIRIAATEPA